ncbi:Nn.00g007040.m01.CDS01 [Neocucurbitaria sp. VM-36]
MPGQFRTRLRRVLTGSPDEGGPLSKFKAGRHTKTGLPESDFYQPGEKMPPLKYRRPVDPEHKKTLEAFSFSTAWRRHSHTSLYSPMGSRLPSRRSSFRSRRGRSRSRSKHRSRRSSFSSDYDHEEWVDSGIGASIAGDERPANIREASDDEGDVLNVGLSRNPTEDPRDARRKQSTGARRSSSVRQSSRPDTGSDRTRNASQPFSPEELEMALAKSHLEATKEESDRSAAETPLDDFDDPSPFLRPRGGSIYVPYDGQGTPPKLPFWGTAFPSVNDELSSGHFSRRCSVAGLESGACSPQFERRESLFVPTDAPGLTQARRTSVFAPEEEPCVCPEPSEPPKRKVQPCAPCDAIAAILARPD